MPEIFINSGGACGLGETGAGASLSDLSGSNPSSNNAVLQTLFTTPTQTELISLCSGWLGYISDFSCWAYSPSIWQQAATQMGPISVTPGAPAAPASALAPPYDVTPVDAQTASNDAMTATQQAVVDAAALTPEATPIDQCQLFTADWPWPLSGLSCSQMVLFGLIGVMAFTFISGGSPGRYGR